MFLRLLPHHSRNPLWGLINKFEKVGRNFFTTPFSLSLFSFPPGSYPYFPPLACLLFCSCARPSRLCPSRPFPLPGPAATRPLKSSLGSALSSHSVVRGGTRAEKAILAYLEPGKGVRWQGFRFFSYFLLLLTYFFIFFTFEQYTSCDSETWGGAPVFCINHLRPPS